MKFKPECSLTGLRVIFLFLLFGEALLLFFPSKRSSFCFLFITSKALTFKADFGDSTTSSTFDKVTIGALVVVFDCKVETVVDDVDDDGVAMDAVVFVFTRELV